MAESHIDETAQEFGLPVLAKMPIDPEVAKLCDNGLIELIESRVLEPTADALEK